MKIVVTGPAKAYASDTEKPVSDPVLLRQFDGLAFSKDKCSNYFDTALLDIGITGGTIILAYDQKGKRLSVVSEYQSPRKLTPQELKMLVAETSGQWSDGIGEEEFLHRKKMKMELDISPSVSKKIKAEQINDGKKVNLPRIDQLIVAIRDDKVAEAKQFIADGAEVNGKDRDGETALHHACLGGHTDLALALVERGASVNAANKGKSTPLAYLAMTNFAEPAATVKVAKVLVAKGADVDARDKEGITPLMWAVNRGKLELVKFLISAGADVNAKDRQKYNESTVIMYAQKLEIAKLLLKHKADPCVCNAGGDTAWEYALRNTHLKGYQELEELLRKHGQKKK